MSLNESTVEAAALKWFGELRHALGHGPQMAPGEPKAERNSFCDVVLAGRLRKAISSLRQAFRRRQGYGGQAGGQPSPLFCRKV